MRDIIHIAHSPDIMFLGTTPANRPDSPEYMPRGGGGGWESEHLANQMSLYDEAARKDAESDDTLDDEWVVVLLYM